MTPQQSSLPAESPSALDDLLDGVRVVEWTGVCGAYAGRLLADLGADVIRVVPSTGDPLAQAPPFVHCPGGEVSAFELFVNLNKRSVVADPATPGGRELVATLLAEADIFIDGAPLDDRAVFGWTDEQLHRAHPRLTHVSVLPFGAVGPYSRYRGGELVQMAAGGLLSLAGHPERAPTLAHGNQSDLAASIQSVVAALVGLLARDRDGSGTTLDVSAQAVVAGALEDAVSQADLTGRTRRRRGHAAREAGTGIFPCRDGYIAVVAGRLGTAAAWQALTSWLVDDGVEGADELCGGHWGEFHFRQTDEAIARFTEVFSRFTRGWDKADLYEAGQARRIAIAPVNTIAEVLTNPQLAHRSFFRSVTDPRLGRSVTYPGTPYRIDGRAGTRVRPAPVPGEHTAEVQMTGGGA